MLDKINLIEYLPAWIVLFISSLGSALFKKKFSIINFLADCFINLTVGMSLFYICLDYGYSEHLSLAIAIMASHKGTRLLFLIDEFLLEWNESRKKGGRDV